MPKVSIIMPSLNVAPYIRECIDSVVHQTLEDIEILCVDAGSSDGTWEILEEYAKKDSRVRLIRSEKKSYGCQMNLGLKEVAGEYIGIVETDDFILPEMYRTLYDCAKEQDAEVVKSDFDVFTTLPDDGRIFLRYSLKKFSNVKYNEIFSAEDYEDGRQRVDTFIWNGIYKKDFLREHHIRFQETPGAAFQDIGFRYQVAMSVKRGLFLEDSFYRYRRDNINSSTYNSKTVLFNLSEIKYLLRLMKETGRERSGQMLLFAKGIAGMACRPYIELLTWGKPADGTKEALTEFRLILKDFMERRILSRTSFTAEEWLEFRMFMEKPGFYDYYAHLKAETAAQAMRGFLKDMVEKQQIVLFGSGIVGTRVYCLLRNNGIQNIEAFCDNDRRKQGSVQNGCTVLSPEESVKRFPEAFFLITNAGHADEIQKQLSGLGVEKQRRMTYGLTTNPMDCTNMVLRLLEK